jgi:hypothetical protein
MIQMKPINSTKTSVFSKVQGSLIILTSMTLGLNPHALAQATSSPGRPCKILIPVPSYRGYCYCTDTSSGFSDGTCVKADRWDLYEVCGSLTDPNTQSGKTTCIPGKKPYGREIICTRETNWANLATFVSAGMGAGALAGGAIGAVGALPGGTLGGLLALNYSWGCPIRTCTSTDGKALEMPAYSIYEGSNCRNIDGK